MNELTHDERNAARLFGLRENFQPLINIFLPSFKIAAGQIISITGDSGTGKTLFLEMIEKSADQSVCNLNKIKYQVKKSAFQNIFKEVHSVDATLKLLGKTGLAEAGLILRPVKTYSAGENFRFRIALAIARKHKVLLIDEFGLQLDETLAINIAFSLRKTADRQKITIFVASCGDSYVRDLQPDLAFKLDETGFRLYTRKSRHQRISYHRKLTVERQNVKIWQNFARWHYKSHHTGPTSDVFSLNLDGKPIGVIVYGYPSMFSSPRNTATDNRYAFNQPHYLRRLNAEVRIIRRVVMAPKFRGVGLAATLVRESLEMLPPEIKHVECLTSMGEYCGFLQNAGFDFIKKTDTPKIVTKFSEALTENAFDEKNSSSEKFLTWLKSLPEHNHQKVRKLLNQMIKMRVTIKHPSLRKKELSETENAEKFHSMIEEVLAARFTRPSYFIKYLRRIS